MKAKEIVLLIFIIAVGVFAYHVQSGKIDVTWDEIFDFDLNEYTYEETQVVLPCRLLSGYSMPTARSRSKGPRPTGSPSLSRRGSAGTTRKEPARWPTNSTRSSPGTTPQ